MKEWRATICNNHVLESQEKKCSRVTRNHLDSCKFM